nr:GatB/YqeY domain-containing protein [Modestobacter versicolor]
MKDRLRTDLTTAMKGRDELSTATLRMVLSAVSAEEVSGKEARELTDDDVMAVLRREAKKRREAAEAFAGAGRAEQAERERAEEGVIAAYLPAQLDDADLAAIVADVVTRTGASGMKDMGRVMGAVTGTVAGRAEGGRVAAEVRRQLG